MIWQLFHIFFKIGAITIGGGYAILPMIQQELVGAGLMTMGEMTDIISISQATPGPFSLNAATFVGMKLAGFPGAVICTAGIVLPSAIICLLVAKFFFNINKKPAVQGILAGIRPCIIALIAGAGLLIAQEAFLIENNYQQINYSNIIIGLICLLLLEKFKLSPIWVIIISGLLAGIFYLLP